jgi:hypothetical protein
MITVFTWGWPVGAETCCDTKRYNNINKNLSCDCGYMSERFLRATVVMIRDLSVKGLASCQVSSVRPVLQGLHCGSTYHLFLAAQNKIGTSAPSPTLSVKTQGRAPGVPEAQTLLSPNSTSVLLRLHVWPDNGCPLTHFVLQYRPVGDTHWTLGMPHFYLSERH